MFQVTDRAAQQLKTALTKAEDTESACFRIGVADNEVQLVVDQERPGDTTIEHEGKTLVVLDPTAGNLLSNRELDFDNEASGLVLKEAG
jgi:Fe-S cluster assembly iron-binding protein IscA